MERSVGAYMEERCYCSNFDVSRRPRALLDAVQHALVHRDSLRELALLNPPLVAQVADAGTDDVHPIAHGSNPSQQFFYIANQ